MTFAMAAFGPTQTFRDARFSAVVGGIADVGRPDQVMPIDGTRPASSSRIRRAPTDMRGHHNATSTTRFAIGLLVACRFFGRRRLCDETRRGAWALGRVGSQAISPRNRPARQLPDTSI